MAGSLVGHFQVSEELSLFLNNGVRSEDLMETKSL